jgi:REP element-mobilizing transposase RayT
MANVEIRAFKGEGFLDKEHVVMVVHGENKESASEMATQICNELLERTDLIWEYRWNHEGSSQGHYVSDFNKYFRIKAELGA